MRKIRHVVLPVKSWQYIGLLVVSLACLTLGHVSRDREGKHGSLAGPELQHTAPHELDASPNDKLGSCPASSNDQPAINRIRELPRRSFANCIRENGQSSAENRAAAAASRTTIERRIAENNDKNRRVRSIEVEKRVSERRQRSAEQRIGSEDDRRVARSRENSSLRNRRVATGRRSAPNENRQINSRRARSTDARPNYHRSEEEAEGLQSRRIIREDRQSQRAAAYNRAENRNSRVMERDASRIRSNPATERRTLERRSLEERRARSVDSGAERRVRLDANRERSDSNSRNRASRDKIARVDVEQRVRRDQRGNAIARTSERRRSATARQTTARRLQARQEEVRSESVRALDEKREVKRDLEASNYRREKRLTGGYNSQRDSRAARERQRVRRYSEPRDFAARLSNDDVQRTMRIISLQRSYQKDGKPYRTSERQTAGGTITRVRVDEKRDAGKYANPIIASNNLNYDVLRQAFVIALCAVYGATAIKRKNTIYGSISQLGNRLFVW